MSTGLSSVILNTTPCKVNQTFLNQGYVNSAPFTCYTHRVSNLTPRSTLFDREKLHFHVKTVPSPVVKVKVFVSKAMENVDNSLNKGLPVDSDAGVQEEYSYLSKLLEEFTCIPSFDKSWTFKSPDGNVSGAMFWISQPNILANSRKTYILSSHIVQKSENSVDFLWAPFPIEVSGGSTIVPSPSGSKQLIIRQSEDATHFEIWGSSEVKKEFLVSKTVHGSVYADGWFEGISWNQDETAIAYIAEEPNALKPTFGKFGFKNDGAAEKDHNSWKGQGDWEENWGEAYVGKRKPALFVIDINSGETCAVKGIENCLSVGQVVWAPSTEGPQYLVFVGWPSHSRMLGIKYCYNRPCFLYAVKAPLIKSEGSLSRSNATEDSSVIKLTPDISSAFSPRFSPDGKHLVFLSAKCSVDSGAHSATESLHYINWPSAGNLSSSLQIVDVVPVVMCPEDGCFPGLYNSKILSKPWLSDGQTMVLSSVWHSVQMILAVNVISGKLSPISPNTNSSWDILALDGDNIIAVCSSIIDIPNLKFGTLINNSSTNAKWSWLDVTNPIIKCSERVKSLMASLESSILKIPVTNASENLTEGARKPIEAIYVSSKTKKSDEHNRLIVILHGGPHSVSLSSFSKSLTFLSSLGFNLLVVNYRGSLGFGEEALQSLPGKIGSQDVDDVLAAVDYVIANGLADPSKIAVLGGSHGGFLTTHLIGQAPDKFIAAAARNPVCNLALMVGTSDIPDWVFFEGYGSNGKSMFTDAPTAEQLDLFYTKSPISHISKVKTPTLFLLGAKDLRVPVSNGLQYARALKEKGVETKVIVFPEDIHGIDRPQSDFESFLNIGIWFNKYCA